MSRKPTNETPDDGIGIGDPIDPIDPAPEPPKPGPADEGTSQFVPANTLVDVLKRGLVAAHGSPAQTAELQAFIRDGEAALAAIGETPHRIIPEPETPELPPYARPGASESA